MKFYVLLMASADLTHGQKWHRMMAGKGAVLSEMLQYYIFPE